MMEAGIEKPITERFLRQIGETDSLIAQAIANDDPSQALSVAIARLWQAVGQAVSVLESEVVLLRRLVHGNNPDLQVGPTLD
jgi:hypothetical protein